MEGYEGCAGAGMRGEFATYMRRAVVEGTRERGRTAQGWDGIELVLTQDAV